MLAFIDFLFKQGAAKWQKLGEKRKGKFDYLIIANNEQPGETELRKLTET